MSTFNAENLFHFGQRVIQLLPLPFHRYLSLANIKRWISAEEAKLLDRLSCVSNTSRQCTSETTLN